MNYYFSAASLDPRGVNTPIDGPNSRILVYQRKDSEHRYNDKDWHVSNDYKARKLGRENYSEASINVHIPMDFTKNAGTFYHADWRPQKFIFVDADNEIERAEAGIATLSHEIGHALSLEHTHVHFDRGMCKQEPVSLGRKLKFFEYTYKWRKVGFSVNGDNLCDTRAEPELNRVKKSEGRTSSLLFTNGCT